MNPILFCLYLDGLLAILAESNVGCFIGTWYFGALAYADDIVLLAPSARAMRLMLKICDEYAEGFDIIFNAKKSKCIFIRARRNTSGPVVPMPFFSIVGIQSEFVNQWSHLGHLITDSLDDNNDIAVRRNTLCGQINNVISYLANLDAVTKLNLFNTYCSSFYGSVLWDLESPVIQDVCIAWRKGLRRVWGGCLLICTVTVYL